MISDDQLNALKARNPVDVVAAQWVGLRKKRAGEYVGPCPMCSEDPFSKSAMRFECDADKWVCAVCQAGGDVIALVMKREGLSFSDAIERLGGTRDEVVTPALAEKRGLQDYRGGAGIGAWPANYAGDHALLSAWERGWRLGERRAEYANKARARERNRLLGFWERAFAIKGTPVEVYLAGRGLLYPANAKLRFFPSMPYFADGRERAPLKVHTGPAMLAAIYDADRRFAGVHTTWLAPGGAGKAEIVHPETGEEMPAKKVRGSKAGGYINLGGYPLIGSAPYTRMVAGEGIETVLAAYSGLVRQDRLRQGVGFRSAIDLGNIGGRALKTLPHPDLKDAGGRPRRVAGPDPDLESLAMPVPDDITSLVLLGDGDSDPFLTQNALERARARYTRPGRAVSVKFARGRQDFNDMIKTNHATASREEMQQ